MAAKKPQSGVEALVDLTKQAHLGIRHGSDASRIITFGIYILGAVVLLTIVCVAEFGDKIVPVLKQGMWLVFAFAVFALFVYALIVLLPVILSARQQAHVTAQYDRVAEEKAMEADHG